MKLKLNQINPNPFKKEINKGKLDKEQVARIKSNIKELGLMGSIPIVKIGNKYHCVSHHHRIQALKEVYGNNFQIEVTLHKYNNDQMLRGMVIENLTQRAGDFKEEIQNLVAIENHLKKNQPCPEFGHGQKRTDKGRFDNEAGSTRQIADWLNKHGEVMSVGKIGEWMRVHKSLEKAGNLDMINEVSFNVGHTHQAEGKVSIEDIKNISRIEDGEQQKAIKNIIVDVMSSPNPLNYKQKAEAIQNFRKATPEIQKKVIEEKIKLTDIVIETHKAEVGEIDLSRGKHYIEQNYEMMNKLTEIFKEKMYLKKCPPSELEMIYHFLIGWTKEELIPFMKEIEKEFKLRGNKKVVIYDLTERTEKGGR